MHLEGHVALLLPKKGGGTEHQPLTAIPHTEQLSVDEIDAIAPRVIARASPQGLGLLRKGYFWFHSKP